MRRFDLSWDVLASASVAILAFILSTRLSLFERLFGFADRTNAWHQLDAIFAMVVCLGSFSLFLAIRQARRLRSEIRRREAAEAEAFQSARHDTLTKLPNRLFFAEAVSEALARDDQCAVLFIDLDGFKPVNDTFGHEVGDALLIAVSRRIALTAAGAVQVARLGGDEFGVLVDGPTDAQGLAERLSAAFAAPLRIGGAEVSISLSIGIAAGPEEDLTADDLIRRADLSMYGRKRARSLTLVGDASPSSQVRRKESREARTVVSVKRTRREPDSPP